MSTSKHIGHSLVGFAGVQGHTAMAIVLIVVVVHQIRGGTSDASTWSRWEQRVSSQQRTYLTRAKGRVIKASHTGMLGLEIHLGRTTPPGLFRLVVWKEAAARCRDRSLQAIEVEDRGHTARHSRGTTTTLRYGAILTCRPVDHVFVTIRSCQRGLGSEASADPVAKETDTQW